jgi:hypothetical protein
MAENFVTVATFNQTYEAQLAKNLLENEGIAGLMSGEFTSDVMFGNTALGDQIVLKVPEEEAGRAAGILATVQAARLEPDWEKQAEAGVWVCSICGEAISNRLSMCYACQTPREGIRADAPRDRHAIQPANEDIQKSDEITNAPVSPPSSVKSPLAEKPEEDTEPPPLSPLDEVARHAFGAALFCLLTVCLSFPLSAYYLAQIFFSDEDLTPRGRRYLYGALLINGTYLLIILLIFLSYYRGS